MVNKRFT